MVDGFDSCRLRRGASQRGGRAVLLLFLCREEGGKNQMGHRFQAGEEFDPDSLPVGQARVIPFASPHSHNGSMRLHDPRKPAAPLQPAPPQMPRCCISKPCRRTKHHHRVRALRRQRVEGERDLNLPDERPQRSLVPYQRGRGKWPRARRLSYRPVEGQQDLAVRANPSGFLSAATFAINH